VSGHRAFKLAGADDDLSRVVGRTAQTPGGTSMITTRVEMLLVELAWRVRAERGASLTEYALLVGLIAAACLASIEFLGESAAAKLSTVGESIGQP
jgi:Flp pilus assembly pilin Flp